MNVRPAGREACNCASPYNSILERLDAMEAEILAVQATANSAMGVANAQAGAAASSASAAAASATAAGNAAISAAADASDALTQATASAGSADDAADSASNALTALQTIEGTIASVLASDIGGKVDKLTTAGFYLYMHNGSTQGEVQPVVTPTAATIPIRDGDGRMQAADPASGATDKTLVTANWVSQTGDSSPNNLMHRTGAETVAGLKDFTDSIDTPNHLLGSIVAQGSTGPNSSKWHKFYSWTASSTTANQTLKFGFILRQLSDGYSEVLVNVRSTTTGAKMIHEGTGAPASSFRITRDDDAMAIWVLGYRITGWLDFNVRATSSGRIGVAVTEEDPVTDYDEPSTDPASTNYHAEVYTPS